MFAQKLWPFSALIILALLAAPQAGAHDAKLHKGKPVAGEIVSVTDGKMELKTAAGPLTLSGRTKYEHGKQTVTKGHLKVGEAVSVFGTKLPTGELVAREVLIGTAESLPHHK